MNIRITLAAAAFAAVLAAGSAHANGMPHSLDGAGLAEPKLGMLRDSGAAAREKGGGAASGGKAKSGFEAAKPQAKGKQTVARAPKDKDAEILL